MRFGDVFILKPQGWQMDRSQLIAQDGEWCSKPNLHGEDIDLDKWAEPKKGRKRNTKKTWHNDTRGELHVPDCFYFQCILGCVCFPRNNRLKDKPLLYMVTRLCSVASFSFGLKSPDPLQADQTCNTLIARFFSNGGFKYDILIRTTFSKVFV